MSILENIYESTLKFLEPLTPDETYKKIVNEAIKLINGDSGRIFMSSRSGFDSVYSSSSDMPLPNPRKKGNVYKSFISNKAMIVHTNEVKDTYPQLRKIGIRSIMYVPLSNVGVVYGVLVIRSKEDRRFAGNELSVMKLFGSLASLAIRKAQLYEETKIAADTRDLFISLAAHELRTPLTTLMGYVQLVLARLKNKKTVDSKWIYEIALEANRLKALINEFLEINRIRTGKVQYEWQEVNLTEVIKRAIDGFKFVKPNRKLNFITKLNKKRDVVIADKDQLIRVVINLLENADKYSPANKPISINLKYKDQNFWIEVVDKGQGIPEEDIPYIFKGFYKGKKSLHEGMGLGLFLAKNIIDRHQGEISIKSKLGIGTKIIVKLPKLEKI